MQKGRHKKVRYVQTMPRIVQFSPRGKAGRPEEIQLTVDQFEAVRLADFQGYHHVEAAEFMGISRPTFGRILKDARRTIADALINGKIIRIRVGDVQVGVRYKSLPHKKEADLPKLREEFIRKKILSFPVKPAKD